MDEVYAWYEPVFDSYVFGGTVNNTLQAVDTTAIQIMHAVIADLLSPVNDSGYGVSSISTDTLTDHLNNFLRCFRGSMSAGCQ